MTEQDSYIKQVRDYIEQFEGDTDGAYDLVPSALDNGSIRMSMHPSLAAGIVMGQVEQA